MKEKLIFKTLYSILNILWILIEQSGNQEAKTLYLDEFVDNYIEDEIENEVYKEDT